MRKLTGSLRIDSSQQNGEQSPKQQNNRNDTKTKIRSTKGNLEKQGSSHREKGIHLRTSDRTWTE